MPTEPNQKILDPDFAKAGAREIIDDCCPLLREVVNHASHAFLRCQFATQALGGVDEDVAPFALYRIVTETTDGIEVLLRESCGFVAVPLLRTAFEATLSLEYVNRGDSARRGLTWFYVQHADKLRLAKLMCARFESGKTYAEAWQREYGAPHPEPDRIESTISNLDEVLRKPHLAAIAAEYDRLRRSRAGRRPHWYTLFDGPTDLRHLAILMTRETDYDFLYRYWSGIAHAHDVSAFLTSLSDGTPAFRGMRYPGDLMQVAQLAVIFQVRATRLMIERYRHGEDLSRWYLAEVKPQLERLAATTFIPHVIEEK